VDLAVVDLAVVDLAVVDLAVVDLAVVDLARDPSASNHHNYSDMRKRMVLQEYCG